MNSVLLNLGGFKFSLLTAAYESLQRQWQFNWPAQERMRNIPAKQFTGMGDQSINLPGVIYPGQYGEGDFIERVAETAATGVPLQLVSGTGAIMGFWCVETISESRKVLFPDGTPRKIEFSIKLTYYGDRYL
jgi:hypothetical protein